MKWDKNIDIGEPTPFIEGKSSFYKMYSKNIKKFTFEARDFYEKCFVFTHNGAMYRYTCSFPNSESTIPVKNGGIRGESLINMAKMYRDDDNKIKFTVLVQCDFKLKLPSFIFSSFLPGAFKKF